MLVVVWWDDSKVVIRRRMMNIAKKNICKISVYTVLKKVSSSDAGGLNELDSVCVSSELNWVTTDCV